jgi:hypothetical protein
MLLATQVTSRPTHGAPTVEAPGPELPAAATTLVPRRTALSDATAVGLSGLPDPPRLMLMTCATGLEKPLIVRGETESSIAMVITEVKHPPTAPVSEPTLESASLQTL